MGSRRIPLNTLVLLTGLVVLVFLSACSSNDPASPAGGGTEPPRVQPKVGFGVSGLLFENNLVMWFRENDGSRSELFPQMYFTRTDVSNYPVWGSFPASFLVSGGPPKDGIPALVDPRFVNDGSDQLRYLRDSDLVLGVVINGIAKAYPENILWWHEITNDHVGGVGVIMTLCPLTGTGMLFKSPSNGNIIDKLELLPVIETTWQKWKEMYPNTKALSQDTGFDRNYTAYPYNDYRDENTLPLFGLRTGSLDTQFPPKHTVLGLAVGDAHKAYAFSRLAGNPVVNDAFNGKNILIVSELRSRLAIPYDRDFNGQTLTFSIVRENPFQMKDNETGSMWNLKGEAESGALAGSKLTQLPAHNAFWFAWKIFWPRTEVFVNGQGG